MTYIGTVLRDGGAKINDGSLDGGKGSGVGISSYVDIWSSRDGTAVKVSGRFIKVQTAYFQYGGPVGEHSTEIYSATGLGSQTDFPLP
jgi:hypothetical protein